MVRTIKNVKLRQQQNVWKEKSDDEVEVMKKRMGAGEDRK